MGLGFLAIGLIGLLLRNLAETERTAADDLWHYRLFTEGGRAADRTAGPKLWRYAKYTKALQWVGIVSTLVGLLSLVIVLTLLIIS